MIHGNSNAAKGLPPPRSGAERQADRRRAEEAAKRAYKDEHISLRAELELALVVNAELLRKVEDYKATLESTKESRTLSQHQSANVRAAQQELATKNRGVVVTVDACTKDNELLRAHATDYDWVILDRLDPIQDAVGVLNQIEKDLGAIAGWIENGNGKNGGRSHVPSGIGELTTAQKKKFDAILGRLNAFALYEQVVQWLNINLGDGQNRYVKEWDGNIKLLRAYFTVAQEPHCDFPPRATTKKLKSPSTRACSAMRALQNGTSLVLFVQEDIATGAVQTLKRIVVPLLPDQLIIWHADLLHSGAEYSDLNWRLFYYLPTIAERGHKASVPKDALLFRRLKRCRDDDPTVFQQDE